MVRRRPEDPTAFHIPDIRMDVSDLFIHYSERTPKGAWYQHHVGESGQNLVGKLYGSQLPLSDFSGLVSLANFSLRSSGKLPRPSIFRATGYQDIDSPKDRNARWDYGCFERVPVARKICKCSHQS